MRRRRTSATPRHAPGAETAGAAHNEARARLAAEEARAHADGVALRARHVRRRQWQRRTVVVVAAECLRGGRRCPPRWYVLLQLVDGRDVVGATGEPTPWLAGTRPKLGRHLLRQRCHGQTSWEVPAGGGGSGGGGGGDGAAAAALQAAEQRVATAEGTARVASERPSRSPSWRELRAAHGRVVGGGQGAAVGGDVEQARSGAAQAQMEAATAADLAASSSNMQMLQTGWQEANSPRASTT